MNKNLGLIGILVFVLILAFIVNTESVDPPVTSVCGNGIVEGDEACDDGNTYPCGGCNADCTRVQPECGDGIIECGECCDDGNDYNFDNCPNDCECGPQ